MPDEGPDPDGEGNQSGHGDRAGAALDATEGQGGGNPTKSG